MYEESSVSTKLNYACFISNYGLKAGLTSEINIFAFVQFLSLPDITD